MGVKTTEIVPETPNPQEIDVSALSTMGLSGLPLHQRFSQDINYSETATATGRAVNWAMTVGFESPLPPADLASIEK